MLALFSSTNPDIDLRTVFTLVAYNEGLVSIEDLSLLQKTDAYTMFRGTMDKYVKNDFQSDPEAGVPASDDTEGASADMSIGMYFDFKYPNMDPIYIDSFGNAALRLESVRAGRRAMLPLVPHFVEDF